MKKKRVTLVVIAILGLFLTSFQLNAQNYHFTVHQGKVLMHCDTEDSTYVYLTLSDPNGELMGPFTVLWTLYNTTDTVEQGETGFYTVDTLRLNNKVKYEVFDGSMASIWLDSTFIYDEDKPNLMIYPGYQRPSHACYGTGRTKLQVPTPYIMSNVWIDDPNAILNDGNHVIIDSITGGRHTFSYYINNCKYYEEIEINTFPKPDLEMNQKDLATCIDGKHLLMLSDSMVIDSILLNNYKMLTVDDTTYRLHAPGGNNEIVVYAKNCFWHNNFFTESQDANILKVEKVVNPHENLSTGQVSLSSKIGIQNAWFILDGIETPVLFNRLKVNYKYLPAGKYIFRVKDRGECVTDIEYELSDLTGNPVPTGFSSDSIFDFKIDGIPINQVPEIGDQYRLIIHKTEGVGNATLVFDTNRGDQLPWDKKLNGEIQHGYFMYYLEITNPKYIGKSKIKSYFRLFKAN